MGRLVYDTNSAPSASQPAPEQPIMYLDYKILLPDCPDIGDIVSANGELLRRLQNITVQHSMKHNTPICPVPGIKGACFQPGKEKLGLWRFLS